MKKLTALILAALMILAALPMTSLAGRFDDVPNEKWYSEGISFCAANEYMAGTSETVFERNGTLTRSMFMTILAKVDGADLTEYEGKSSFSDVRTDGWYTSAIEWAYQNKLASGIGDGAFGYKNPVTREQMALFLFSYTEYVNANSYDIVVPDIPIEYNAPIDTTLRADLSVFKDADRVHSWAKDAMEWAVACGLFSGIGEDLLDPRGNCTRAQAAVLIRAFVLNFLSDCEHEWIESTCSQKGYCTKCGLKSGLETDHIYPEAYCHEEVKCTKCDSVSKGSKHFNVTSVSCTTPAQCTHCKLILEPATGHVPRMWATCTSGVVCDVCSNQYIKPLGHTTKNGICERCDQLVYESSHTFFLYHLNTLGQTDRNGNKCFYFTESYGDFEYEYYIYTVPGTSVFYTLCYVYDTLNDIVYYTEIEFPGLDQPVYKFTAGAFDANYTYYSITGGIVPSTFDENGFFLLYDYKGDPGNQSVATALTSNMLVINLAGNDQFKYISLWQYGLHLDALR